jgi:hypothetical protein
MEPKPLGFHKTQGTNNHIEQNDAFLFALNSVGVTYNQLSAMLTSPIHILFLVGKDYAISNRVINVQRLSLIPRRIHRSYCFIKCFYFPDPRIIPPFVFCE